MPTYTYKCRNMACEHIFEEVQRITDDPLTECPKCGEETTRIIVASNFTLKGEKWFKNSGEY